MKANLLILNMLLISGAVFGQATGTPLAFKAETWRATLGAAAPVLADSTAEGSCVTLMAGREKGSWGHLMLTEEGRQADVDVTFKLRFLPAELSGGYAGIVLRKTADGPGVGVSLVASESHLLYQGPPKGEAKYTVLPLEKGVAHGIHVVLKGDRGRVAVDGATVLDLVDLPPEEGHALLRVWECNAAFSDIVFRTPDATPLAVANMVCNGDFEFGASVSGLPYGWSPCGWGVVDPAVLADLEGLAGKWIRTTENPAHGEYCMKVGASDLFGTFFPIHAGTPHTLSVMLRADEPAAVRLRFVTWRAPSGDLDLKKTVEVGREWKRFDWPLPSTDANHATMFVDAVSVTAGTEAPAEYVADAYQPGVQREAFADALRITPARLPQEPALDDGLAAAAWSAGTPFALRTNGGAVPQDATDGRIGYTDEALHIVMRCADAHPAEVRAQVTQRDGHVWNDDCVELFIGPSGPRGDWADYFHLGVSASGARYDARKQDPTWNAEWTAATRRLADGWEVSLRIPFNSLGLNEFNLGDWTINFCRENPRTREVSAWSPTYGTFHNHERFGLLTGLPRETLARHAQTTTAAASAQATPTGCLKLDGKPFFPFGVCWSTSHNGRCTPSEEAIRALAAMGCNCIDWQVILTLTTPEEVRATLDCLQCHNIKVLLWIDAVFGAGDRIRPYTQEQVVAMRDFILQFRGHPAIAGWMVFDEPHEKGDFVRQAVEELKRLSPDRPLSINVTPHGLGMRIADLPGDIVMFDRYCFGFDGSDIADVGETARVAAREADGRPVWAFLMTGGNTLWMHDSPSAQEHYAQYYTALANGVSGFFGFANVPPSQETRNVLKQIGEEFAVLLPELYAGQPSTVQCVGGVNFIAREKDGALLLVAANPSRKAAVATFTLPWKPLKAEPLYDGEGYALEGATLRASFAPLQRQVWRLKME